MKGIQKKDLLLGLSAGSVALLVFTGKFGYCFGQGDQDEFIPYLLRFLDPGLYASDWFINQQVEHFNVRTYFVWFMFPIAKVLNPTIAVRLVYGVSFLATSLAIYHLSLLTLKNRPLSIFAPLTVLSLSHKWTLGSNDLIYSMLVPEILAWPFAIWAMYFIVNKSFIVAAFLLGIASWFQVLVGVQSAFIWAIVILIFLFQRKVSFQEFLGFLGAVAITSLPSTGPILLSLLSESSLDKGNLFYILAAFRNPFHHLLFSFAFGSVIKFFVLLTTGILAWLLFLRSREFEKLQSLVMFIGVCAVLLLVNLLLTEVAPVLFVAKLQWFKLTVLIKMILVILLLGGVKHFVSTFFTKPKSWTRHRSWHSFSALFVFIASSVIWIGLTQDGKSDSSSTKELEEWVKENTPPDALFAIPPSNSSFRTRAQRSIYINYASFPYRDPDMITWFNRLQEIAPVGRPERALGIKPVLDRAFHQNIDEVKLSRLEVDYILQKKEIRVLDLRSNPVYENDRWSLHELSRSP